MDKRALLLVGLLCLTGLAGAMVSTNYDLSWHVSGGGGGPMSSTNYRMDSTVGQIIGVAESTNYRLEAGYWSDISTLPPKTILDYYRSWLVTGDPNVVETQELLKAADDWSNDVVPPGFTSSITTQELLQLADEWAAS